MNRFILSAICLVAGRSDLCAQRPQPAPVPPSVEAKLDIPYAGTDNIRQRLDLYLPKNRETGTKLPVLVFVHGGAWLKSADPVTYVDVADPPFLMVHGDKDPLVPHGQSELLEAALKKAGVAIELYTVPGGGHGGFRDPAVPQRVEAFLRVRFAAAEKKPQAASCGH